MSTNVYYLLSTLALFQQIRHVELWHTAMGNLLLWTRALSQNCECQSETISDN